MTSETTTKQVRTPDEMAKLLKSMKTEEKKNLLFLMTVMELQAAMEKDQAKAEQTQN